MSAIKRLYWEDEMAKVAIKSGVKKPPFSKSSKGLPYPREWLPNCRHWRQPFELGNGATVFASAWLDKPDGPRPLGPGGYSGQPDVGFYLDPKWASGTIVASAGAKVPFVRGPRGRGSIIIYPWEDWGVPQNMASLRRALTWMLKQIRDDKVVEIGCMGGHGRTGTALACMLVLQKLTAQKAINRIWSDYCEEAIETQRQIEFIRTFAKQLGPR